MQEVSMRFNQGKPQWSLVDFKSLEPLVRVMEYGASKYARENWKKGLDLNQVLESLARHLFALMSGEITDLESGEEHIGHIMANSMFWKYHYEKNKFMGVTNGKSDSQNAHPIMDNTNSNLISNT